MITLGALVPHPPIIVSEVGQGEDLAKVVETTAALGEINRILAQAPPETLVVFTPHGTVFGDAIVVYGDETLSGSLSRFGSTKVWQWQNDLELVAEVVKLGETADLPVLQLDKKLADRYRSQGALDHGVLVPLSFFSEEWAAKVKLVVIPLSGISLEDLYKFGTVVQQAATNLNRQVAIIASGDLSHCLIPGAPEVYDPRGTEFDQKIIQLIKNEAVTEFFELDPVLLEKAAQCGFRSLIMLLGTFDGFTFKSKVHSYQGPFGVGYAVASFQPTSGSRPSLITELYEKRNIITNERRQKESPLVRYARQVVEAYVQEESFPQSDGLEQFLVEKAGVFVSIKKHGQLRGCIGTTEPTQESTVSEVKQNAISASTRDPRFNPVEVEELADLVYSVDILKPAEPIMGLEELDPERYGVIVTKGHRRGLLLPNLEGVETAAEQVAIAKQKAGIANDEPVNLERFEVIRYH